MAAEAAHVTTAATLTPVTRQPTRAERREFERLQRRWAKVSAQIDALAERVRSEGQTTITAEEARWARDVITNVIEPIQRFAARLGIPTESFDAYAAAMRALVKASHGESK